jgi:hypothetical protein
MFFVVPKGSFDQISTAKESRARSVNESLGRANSNKQNSAQPGTKMPGKISGFVLAACFFADVVLAQTAVSVSINSTYSNINSVKPIAADFAGLGFEITSVMPGANGLPPGVHLFDPVNNPQPLALFQQMGIKNLRVGAGTGDGCRTPFPASVDIDDLFHFAQAANLKVIYQFRLINPASCAISSLASINAATAQYIWSHYSANVSALSTGNEDDFHAAHSFCTNEVDCICVSEIGCHCRSGAASCSTASNPGLVIRDPAIYEVGVSSGRNNAGSAFPSYLADWNSYTKAITSGAGMTNVPMVGPDAGSYTTTAQFTGAVCGATFKNAGWPQLLAACEKGSSTVNFTTTLGHYYVGGNISYQTYALTAAEAIDNMLSPDWLRNTSIADEPYQPSGIPSGEKLIYTPYTWLYSTNYQPVRELGVEYRLTESNDYLGGVANASNSFAAALWGLDYMHWWAFHGAAGINFHNNQWIYTDTLVPNNNHWKAPGSCDPSPCSTYYITPKGYGIKAFNLSGHGYPVGAPATPINPPAEFSLTSYAVASGQDLYVTIINKTQGTAPRDTASVTITPNGAPFTAASVSSIVLTSGAAGNAGLLTATLGGASIANTGVQWEGQWTPESPDTTGSVTLSAQPATATIVRFHAGSNYAGPIQMDQSGALKIFATDSKGNLWHASQQASTSNTQPSNADGSWNSWTQNLSGVPFSSVIGGPAVAKNQDNTLQVFVPTSGDVFYNQQETPGGAWHGSWTDMGSSSKGMTSLQEGQNADGSLSVFGLDSSGRLWTATELAPGVGWSTWTRLASVSGGIKPGYVVGENLNGRLEIFGMGGTSRPALWHIRQTSNNTWALSWVSLGTPPGKIIQSQLQVARSLTGDLTVFGVDTSDSRGVSGNIWSIAQTTPGSSWGSWTALPTHIGVTMAQGFVAGQNADGRIELFSIGSDGGIYHTWITATGTWSNWTSMSGTNGIGLLDPNLVVGNTNDGRLQVFGVNSSGTVYSNWQEKPGGVWNNSWTSFNNSSSLTFYRGQH